MSYVFQVTYLLLSKGYLYISPKSIRGANIAITDQPYELTIEKRPLYLYATVRGDTINPDIVLSYLSEIFQAFNDFSYTRLLLKKDISAALRVEDYAFIAAEIERMEFGGVKIALVDGYADHEDVNEAGTSKAREQGLNIRYFSSFPKAVDWLLRG